MDDVTLIIRNKNKEQKLSKEIFGVKIFINKIDFWQSYLSKNQKD